MRTEVLEAAHSNCQCSVDPIDDSDFGNLYRVDLAADGRVLHAEQSANY
jgi:hypothetical protein